MKVETTGAGLGDFFILRWVIVLVQRLLPFIQQRGDNQKKTEQVLLF